MLCKCCGKENVKNSTYCIKCGSLLVTPEPPVNSPRDEVRAATIEYPHCQKSNQKTSQISQSNTGLRILGLITGIILIVIIVVEDLIFQGSDVDYYVPLYRMLLLYFIGWTPFGILIFLIKYFRNRKKGISLIYCAKKALSYIIIGTLFWGVAGYSNGNLNLESLERRRLIGTFGYYYLSESIICAAFIYFFIIFIKYISHRKKGIHFEAYEKRINIAVQLFVIVEVLIIFIWFITI